MFCTGESLKCTGCECSFVFPVRDFFVYTEGDLDLSPQNLATSKELHPVLRQRAWCMRCDVAVLAERIPTSKEFMNAAALIKRGPGDRPYVDDELLELSLESISVLFERLSKRTTKGRGLECGSTDWVALEVVNGRIQPALAHEACNSDFQWVGFIAGVIGRVRIRLYSFDGEPLAESSGVA